MPSSAGEPSAERLIPHGFNVQAFWSDYNRLREDESMSDARDFTARPDQAMSSDHTEVRNGYVGVSLAALEVELDWRLLIDGEVYTVTGRRPGRRQDRDEGCDPELTI